MGIPDLVIFDCDGVLVDSEAVSNAVLAEALSAVGVPTTANQAHARYRGTQLQDISDDVFARSGMTLSEDFWVNFQRDRAVAFENTLRPIMGAADTVAAVKAAGIAVCVASQGRRAKTGLTLGLTGLRELFDDRAIFSAYDVPRGKPHPDLFLYAAQQMQTPVASCLVVEDTMIGIRAALAAKMSAVGLASGTEAQLMGRLGVRTIGSLPELLPLLGGFSS